MNELMYLALSLMLWAGTPQPPDYSQIDQTAQEATLKTTGVKRDRTVEPKTTGTRRDRTFQTKLSGIKR